MKRALKILGSAILLAALAFVGLTSLGSSYGTRVEYGESELYYTDAVTKAEAERLGKFLEEAGYFEGHGKSVQLDKVDGRFQVRFVTKNVELTDAHLQSFRLLRTLIATAVFDGTDIDLHLPDEYLKTRKVVT